LSVPGNSSDIRNQTEESNRKIIASLVLLDRTGNPIPGKYNNFCKKQVSVFFFKKIKVSGK